MKLFLLTTFVFLGLSIHAKADSIFSQVRTNFAKGIAPAQNAVTGVFSGRCYTPENQDKPNGALLIGYSSIEGDDNGPLFPSRSVFRVIRAPNPGNKADAYDQMTPELEQYILKTKQIIDAGEHDITEAKIENGSLVSKSKDSNLVWSVRMTGGYIFTESTVLSDSIYSKADEIYTACYFFKKIAD